MAPYLLIETNTAWDGTGVVDLLKLAAGLADGGQSVDLFLIQNAVLMAYEPLEPWMERLVTHPLVTIWVDDFSLASRALPHPHHPQVVVAGADTLVSLLIRPDCKAIWHSA